MVRILAARNIWYPVGSSKLASTAERARTNAINAGVLALLHDRLYQACTFYLKRKYCTLEDRDNLEYMFRPYKALGGNGTGEDLYNRCLALPYEPAEQEV